jgi:predicted esterase
MTMRLRTFYFALIILSSALWIACDSDDDSDDDSTTPVEMMNDQGTGDPHNLGGTYHDYRSCLEQGDDRVEEPMSMMEEEEEEEEEDMMSDMDEEMSMEDISALFEDLPRGSGAPIMGGEYFLRIDLLELGYVLDLNLEVNVMEGASAMRLRAIKDDMLSEPFAEDIEVTINADGHFSAQFFDAVMPGDFSPTGSDVIFSLEVTGSVLSGSTMCGFVTGAIETLDLELSASTFYAQAWDMRSDDQPKSCDGSEEAVGCDRITVDQCPDLTNGENTITSCGIERQVRIRLPSTFDSTRSDYKTIVLFHGLTGEQVDDIEEDTGLNQLVDPYDFLLLSPYSRRLAIEWDQASPGDNPDVALFEDLLTCAQAQLGSDPERLYVAGDSGGGMFTTFLVSQFDFPIAAAAINSGGTIFDLPDTSTRKVPVIYGWGGECDIARGQNFSLFASAATASLADHGHFLVTCNHDSGHEWKPLFSPWFLEFLFAHQKSDTSSPLVGGLPDTIPDFCGIHGAE